MVNSSLQKAKIRNFILLLGMTILAIAIFAIKALDKKKQLIYLPIDVENLQEIVIHQTPVITLKKTGDAWFVVQDDLLPANKKAMSDIFDMLSTPLRDEYPVSEVSLKELSLDPPNLIVELNDEALSFGSLSPMDQMHYVQFKNKIYLASPFLQVRFSQTLKTFTKADEAIEEHKNESLHGDH